MIATGEVPMGDAPASAAMLTPSSMLSCRGERLSKPHLHEGVIHLVESTPEDSIAPATRCRGRQASESPRRRLF